MKRICRWSLPNMAVIALTFAAAQSCEIDSVSPAYIAADDDFVFTFKGWNLGTESYQISFVRPGEVLGTTAPATSIDEDNIQVVLDSSALSGGSLYNAVLNYVGESVVRCELSLPRGIFVHKPLEIIGTYPRIPGTAESPDLTRENSTLNVFGQDQIFFRVRNLFRGPEETDSVFIRYRRPLLENEVGIQSLGFKEEIQPGTIVSHEGNLFIKSMVPAVDIPPNFCKDESASLDYQVSLSINDMMSFSTSIPVKFTCVERIKVAFMFKSSVQDQWTSRINKARLELETMFGENVDVSTYVEGVLETDLETQLRIISEWCAQDYDLIVPGTYGYSTAVKAKAASPECLLAGDGATGVEQAKITYFAGMGTPKYSEDTTVARVYGVTYETRYLMGMTAGYMLQQLNAKSSTSDCVGFIAPFPRAVYEQVNAFLIGCQEIFPDCNVKLMFIGAFYAPEVERDAAAYLKNVAKCSIVIQNTDSQNPQIYYSENGGYSFGYHDDLRPILGDSVLSSEYISWTAGLAELIVQIRDKAFKAKQDLTYGLSEQGVDIAARFSSLIPLFAQNEILEKKAKLAKGTTHIFCGNRQKKYKSVYYGKCSKYIDMELDPNNPDHAKYYAWDPTLFVDTKTNKKLNSSDTITETSCIIDRNIIFSTKYMSFFLDGVDLFDASSPDSSNGNFGGFVNGTDLTVCPEVNGISLEDRYFFPPPSFPMCDGNFFEVIPESCSASTMKFQFDLVWANENNTCGVELVNPELSLDRFLELESINYEVDAPTCNYVPVGSSFAVIGTTFSIAGIIFNAAVVALLFFYRNRKAVRPTQPVIVIFMGIGGILMCASNLLFIGEVTNTKCIARVMLLNLSFDLIFTMLVGKIWRIFRLFSSVKKLKKIIILDKDIIMGACVLMSIDLVFLILWMTLATPVRSLVGESYMKVSLSTGDDEPVQWASVVELYGCASENSSLGTVFRNMTIFFKAMLIVAACLYSVMAKRIWKVPANFVEHNFIIFSAYNAALFSGIILLLTESNDPVVGFAIQAGGIFLATCFINGSLTIPRIMLAKGIWKEASTSDLFGNGSNSNDNSYPHTTHTTKYDNSWVSPSHVYTNSKTSTFEADLPA